MKRYSLTRRVVSLVLLVQLVFAVASTALVYFYERRTYFGALDIALRGHADSLLGAVVEGSDNSDSVLLDATGVETPANERYEVWEKDTLLGRTGDLSQGDRTLRQGAVGFVDRHIGRRRYRIARVRGVRTIDPLTFKVKHELVVLYGSSTDGVWKAVRRAVRFFALGNALILASTGLIVFLLVRRSVAPLDQLAAEASSIAANSWRFAPSVQARSVKELAPLVGALEGAIDRLERSFGQQRVFVSDAAHELKTSVAVVKSSIQLLGMKERTSLEYQAGLERCQADCARMEELVHRMLTLATVEEGDANGRSPSATDIAAGIDAALTELATVAQLRCIQLHHPGDQLVSASIAPDRWKTVCTELVLNALQHSPPGGSVRVSIVPHGSTVTIHFANDGEPIAPDTLPHLFDRFYRGDPSRARSTGGTGLGLAICKAIVEQAGGHIALQNQNGVEVVVELRIGK